MSPFVPAEFIAFGPFLVPVLLLVLVALAWLAVRLIDSGIRRRGVVRIMCLGSGMPLAGWLSLVALSAIGVIQ